MRLVTCLIIASSILGTANALEGGKRDGPGGSTSRRRCGSSSHTSTGGSTSSKSTATSITSTTTSTATSTATSTETSTTTSGTCPVATATVTITSVLTIEPSCPVPSSTTKPTDSTTTTSETTSTTSTTASETSNTVISSTTSTEPPEKTCPTVSASTVTATQPASTVTRTVTTVETPEPSGCNQLVQNPGFQVAGNGNQFPWFAGVGANGEQILVGATGIAGATGGIAEAIWKDNTTPGPVEVQLWQWFGLPCPPATYKMTLRIYVSTIGDRQIELKWGVAGQPMNDNRPIIFTNDGDLSWFDVTLLPTWSAPSQEAFGNGYRLFLSVVLPAQPTRLYIDSIHVVPV